MAKKKHKSYLDKAKDLADVLLYKTSGGALGTPPAPGQELVSFAEMKGLLDMMLRIHALELKETNADEDEPSAFEIIQKEAKNGSKKVKSGSSEPENQFIGIGKGTPNFVSSE